MIATRKDFATPLGAAETDGELLDAVAARCSLDLFADEFAHRREHSIEFQVVWLQHVIGEVRIRPPWEPAPEGVGPTGAASQTRDPRPRTIVSGARA